MKFAFIANVAEVSPQTYSLVYEAGANYNVVAGVDGMEAAKEYVNKLASEGFDLINLCGDFDDEITSEMRSAAGEGIRILHADYPQDQLEKLNALESFEQYGIIIIDAQTPEHEGAVLEGEACKAHVFFVKDLDDAKEAARKLVEKGVYFIELCSWFDKEKTDAVIEAIEGKVPVGSCGL